MDSREIVRNITTGIKLAVIRVTMVFIEKKFMGFHVAMEKNVTHYSLVITWLC